MEVADLARQWGYIWSGKVILESLRNYKDSDGGGGSVTSMRDSSSSGGGNSSPTPPEPQENTTPQWDVD